MEDQNIYALTTRGRHWEIRSTKLVEVRACSLWQLLRDGARTWKLQIHLLRRSRAPCSASERTSKSCDSFRNFVERAGAALATPQVHVDMTCAIHAGDYETVQELRSHGEVHHAVQRGDSAILATISNAGGNPD